MAYDSHSKVKFFFISVLTLLLTQNSTAEMDRQLSMLRELARAAPCIVNKTHCHCALSKPSLLQKCYREVANKSGRCEQIDCETTYKCDCASKNLCQKLSAVDYRVSFADLMNANAQSRNEYRCKKGNKNVPMFISGKTTDFNLLVHQMFSLFLNQRQIGYAVTPGHKVVSTEIKKGDVVSIIMHRPAGEMYGTKLRFIDLEDEVRVMDENWLCGSSFQPGWLDPAFDAVAVGWNPPTSRSIDDQGFDKNVPWMWYNDSEVAYCRYVLP